MILETVKVIRNGAETIVNKEDVLETDVKVDDAEKAQPIVKQKKMRIEAKNDLGD